MTPKQMRDDAAQRLSAAQEYRKREKEHHAQYYWYSFVDYDHNSARYFCEKADEAAFNAKVSEAEAKALQEMAEKLEAEYLSR